MLATISVMLFNKKLFASVLVGALSTTSVALADVERRDHRDRHADEDRDLAREVLGTKRLQKGRGEVSFKVDAGKRRDALQLKTSASRLRILAVEFEYSDGRIIRHEGLDVWQGEIEGSRFTIQFGRPPGLRQVRVEYSMRLDKGAKLQLIQIGDGYTREEDLWKNLKRSYDLGSDGKYYLEDRRR